MNRLLFLVCIVLSSCTPRMSVLVWEDLENGQFHVVGLKNKEQYSDVIKLPPGTKEGDVVKIKVKKEDL